jgi:predicted nucleic acid-binding protein
MQLLVLDSEAISTLAHGRSARRDRVDALIKSRRYTVVTVAVVLAEVIRGRAADAAVYRALKSYGVDVFDVTARVAERAGALLGAVRSGSELAVDAFVVAAVDLAGGGLIATVDADDLARLAAHARSPVRIVSIQP